jgi:hypothetical protein
MKRPDLSSGLVLTGVGVFVIQQSRLLSYRDEFGPGPGLLPFWLGVMLTVFALWQVAAALIPVKNAKGDSPGLPLLRRAGVLLTTVSLAATAALLNVLGFILSLGLLSLFLVYVIERRSLPRAIAVAVVISLAFLLVFRFLLPVQLPLNAWGF